MAIKVAFAKSVRKVMLNDATLSAQVGARIYRAALEERLSSFSAFAKPFIVFNIVVSRSGQGLPTQDATLRVACVVDPDIDKPQEMAETLGDRVIELFDDRPQIIAATGFGVNCHECVKENDDVSYDSEMKTYVASVSFGCTMKAGHLVTSEQERRGL